jgi:hypothetical protein
MDPCTGGVMGWFFGHNFKARYTVGSPHDFSGMKMKGYGVAEGAVKMIEASKPKTYVGDVCVRCGEVTNIKEATDGQG